MSDFGTWLKKQAADAVGSFGDITNILGTPFVNAARNFSAVLKNQPIPEPTKKLVQGDSEFYRNLAGVPQEDSLLETAASILTPFALAKANTLVKGAKGAKSSAAVLREIQDEAGRKPPVFQFSPSDPARKGYETLVANSSGKLDDVKFFEQMADHLVEAGKLPEKEAKRLKALNTKFGSEGSWDYIRDAALPNKGAIETIAPEIPTELKFNKFFGIAQQQPIKSSDAYKDFAGYKREDSASRSRLKRELREQTDIINNIKNNIADLIEPVVTANSKKLGYSTDLAERAKQLGFNTDDVFVRVDSAFSAHANPDFVDPTKVAASGARTVGNEELKGDKARYHGQFFTDVKKGNASAELSKYESRDRFGPNILSPVYLRDDAIKNAYDATDVDQFNRIAEELLSGGLLDAAQNMDVVRDLRILNKTGSQNWEKLEYPSIMAAMKNQGFRGFYTDEPGYLKGNISVFNPEDVRDVRASFDPYLSWSPNRFAAVGAVPVTDPLLEYFNQPTEPK